MLTTVRLHEVTSTSPTPNWGTTSCDFRGDNFIGDAEGDHHATHGKEVDLDDSHPFVQLVLEKGPAVNEVAHEFWLQITSHLSQEEAAVVPHERIGVWDKKAPH